MARVVSVRRPSDLLPHPVTPRRRLPSPAGGDGGGGLATGVGQPGAVSARGGWESELRGSEPVG